MPEELKDGVPFAVKDLPHRRHEQFASIYTSTVGLAGTFFDVALIFGDPTFDPEQRSVYVEDRILIKMSWEHAKALAESLAKAVSDYEVTNKVVVRTPPSVIPTSIG